MSTLLRSFSLLALLGLLLVLPEHGLAYDFEVTARTEGYGYQLRRYDQGGITFLNRRRITQYLGLRIFNLLDPGQDPFAPGEGRRPPALLTLHGLLRFDTDFGGFVKPRAEIPQIENNQFDLMLGALEGRNLLGWIDFSLGRQYDAELMDFFAFDGLRVRVNSPWHLFIESHVGVQVSRMRPFSATVFETDGTSDDPTEEAFSPTFGVAAGTEDLWGLDGRLAYRGTASKASPQGDVPGTETDPLWAVDQELLFASAAFKVPVLETRPLAGVRYNLLLGQLDDLQVGLFQRLLQRHDLQLEYLRSRPHFDGDSIFNIFGTEPYSELAIRYAIDISLVPLELHGRFGQRWFWAAEEETGDSAAISAGLGGLWRTRRLLAALDLYALTGYGGNTLGGDLDGRWMLFRWLTVEGRASLVRLAGGDDGRRSLVNFGFQAGARLRFIRGVRIHLLLEDNISRLFNSALRLLAVLDLEFAP